MRKGRRREGGREKRGREGGEEVERGRMRGRYVLPFFLFIFFHKNEINYKRNKPLVKPMMTPCQFIYILAASRLAPAEAGGLQVASRLA